MQLRRATMADATEVLNWRNDPQSIAMSRTTGKVEMAEHLAWFGKAIKDPNRLILMASEGDRTVGIVRFDRADDAWLVSINLSPQERGKGLGRAALHDAIVMLRKSVGQCRVAAEVKDNNAASLSIFQQSGFVLQEQRDGFHYLTLD